MTDRKTRHILCMIIFLATVCVSHAQNTAAQEERKARLEREIAIIDRQLAENASKSSTMLSDLSLIRKKVANRKALVEESDKEIRRLNDNIYLTQRQINRIQARVDTLTAHYARLVRSAYKNRDARVWYMYMLASDNLSQAFRRFGYFKNLSDQMKNEAQEIRLVKEELEQERQKLSQMKKDAEKVKEGRVKELEELRKDEAKVDKVVRQLNRDKKKYQQ